MKPSILIINHHINLDSFLSKSSNIFDTTVVTSAQNGLDALSVPIPWKCILVAAHLPDMDGLELIEQARSISNAVPLLLVPDTQLAELLLLACNHAVFRVVPESASADILTAILLDGVRQFDLIQQEHRLLTRIEQLTITDPLTGCYTRLYIPALLQKELRRSIRYRHPLSVILCDFDGMARINEVFGHTIGDAVLSGFAEAASQIVRQDIDILARWGGDEFLVILPETPLSGAETVATRLRDRCGQLGFVVDNHTLKCSASFGISGFTPKNDDSIITAEDLLLHAEHCLYQAKAAGINQILCYL
jgi:diguanylate cyclase (GGDEF) domain